MLMEQLRGADWQAEPGLLDSHVSNLRRKIEPDPAIRYVLTIRGIGFTRRGGRKMPDAPVGAQPQRR
jgi:DNA-binding response OmpR family regulator